MTRPVLPALDRFTHQLRDVWESRWLTNSGAQHHELETRLTKLLKTPGLSLFNNGTIALVTAIQSLRLSGEVITTPFTFPATPHVLAWNGIKPIFCDIDPVTMNIDASKIEGMITPKTTGILAVHVFGTPCDVEQIQKTADMYGLKVVYDAAHAFMVEIENKGIGCFGDITMFSFHATKLYHTAEGGALAYSDINLKNRIDLLKNFGIKNESEVIMPGINGKMNEIQAALGILMLDELEKERSRRKDIFNIYKSLLEDVEGISLPPSSQAEVESFQYFPIRIDEKKFGLCRDEVYERFKTFNVFTRKYFFPLCSQYACYRQIESSSPKNLPNATQIVKEVLCLPFYGDLKIEDVEKICSILLSMKVN
ncbi:MAG: DegT/DnrJ/EryC1/StrS family aminotransferase [Desulfobacterales bacterium]|nr:DegT/DnrJ/EryC1/StrS family aminotransferase [Desulfobacterales bacterium]